MYRHLLVPLDNSLLAIELVRQAVRFAETQGAKITFFHAREDYGTSSVAALERVLWPAAFDENLPDETRAIFAKAEVAARERGVEHELRVVVSDRPHEAILRTAEARGCDLIFIASHGRRGLTGLMLGSQTLKVLQQTTIPVLVAAVASNASTAELEGPLAILRDEHRSLAAVVHGLELLARQARVEAKPPPFALLKAIVYYIREFPEKLHHPKEDAYLFSKLRERTSEMNETLDQLERQHRDGNRLIDDLESSIERYESDPEGGLAGFAHEVERFATVQMQHMRLEEKLIMPAALRHLTKDDWSEISRAFAENGDPRFVAETDDEFRALFARILNLAPERAANSQRVAASPSP